MDYLATLNHYAFQYSGIDWLVTFTAFLSIYLIGNKSAAGFIAGMVSCAFGIYFSFQIGSIANGFSSVVLFALYFRGYLKAFVPAPATSKRR